MSQSPGRADVSHTIVARATGLDRPTVSRVRNGLRKPTIGLIIRMRNAFGWQPNDQIISIEAGTYVVDLEVVLTEYYRSRRRGTRSLGS